MPALVRDHMTTQVLTVQPLLPVSEVKALLEQGPIRHLPVVDASGALVGLISDRDLIGRALGPMSWFTDDEVKEALQNMPARDLMTPDPQTVAPDATMVDAARFLMSRPFACLPVVEAGKLVGILTERDFVAAWAARGA
jgi:CBS domain-containing membrane protein